MAKSIAQAQRDAIDSGFLDALGRSKVDFTTTKQLPVTQRAIADAIGYFIQVARENLNKQGKVSTGALSDDLSYSEIQVTKSRIFASVGYPKNSKASKYYAFVNKGVKGVVDKSVNSPFSFKKLSVSKNFRTSLVEWLKINGKANYQNLRPINKLERKRKKISKMLSENEKKENLAKIIGRSIKKKGLKRSGFFDDAEKKAFGKDFQNLIAKSVSGDIKVLIKQYGNNNQ